MNTLLLAMQHQLEIKQLCDYDGRTPLHLAACEGAFATTEWLLAQGAHVDAVDRFGGTPLMDALLHGHAQVAQALLQVRAFSVRSSAMSRFLYLEHSAGHLCTCAAARPRVGRAGAAAGAQHVRIAVQLLHALESGWHGRCCSCVCDLCCSSASLACLQCKRIASHSLHCYSRVQAGARICERGELRQPSESAQFRDLASTVPAALRHIMHPDYEIAGESLQLGAVLGEGEFGVVHRAAWHGTPVAVKVLRVGRGIRVEEFASEIASLLKARRQFKLHF